MLPPLARLTPEQAMYHFLSGYTAKVAGTEAGVTEPEATFQHLLRRAVPAAAAGAVRRDAGRQAAPATPPVWLVNTGWTGGPFGVGERIGIGHTRRLLRAAIAGELEHAPVWTDELFGLHVPLGVEGVPEELLHPRDRWADTAEYDDMARRLAERFVANFDTKFAGSAPQLAQYGPQL